MYTDVQKSVFSKILDIAVSVLELSYPAVRAKYEVMPIYLFEYIEHRKTDKIIEVRFDETGTTLSCYFSENNMCDTSLLLFDDVSTIDYIISYLNNCYKYDYLRSRWILPNCYLSVKQSKDDIYILICK